MKKLTSEIMQPIIFQLTNQLDILNLQRQYCQDEIERITNNLKAIQNALYDEDNKCVNVEEYFETTKSWNPVEHPLFDIELKYRTFPIYRPFKDIKEKLEHLGHKYTVKRKFTADKPIKIELFKARKRPVKYFEGMNTLEDCFNNFWIVDEKTGEFKVFGVEIK